MSAGAFVLLYRLEFADGPPEIGLMHHGTEAECWQLYHAMPAINYKGARRPTQCRLGVFPETILDERHGPW